jgi:hypothetical protein
MTAETFAHDGSKPVRQTLLVADLKCYLCGSVAGSVESEQPTTDQAGKPPLSPSSSRSLRFRAAGSTELRPIEDWRLIRCVRCGGPSFLDDPTIITRRVEEYNWLDERPRRGRPPKRLLEERRRERELLERQSLETHAA